MSLESVKENLKISRVLAIFIGVLIGNGIATGLTSCNDKKKLENFRNSPDNVTVAIISDGELSVCSNPRNTNFVPNKFCNGEIHKSISEGMEFNGIIGNEIITEYDIDYIDDKTVIIYAYNEDENKRNNIVKYIISNAYIDENNIVYINEDNISSDGYKDYRESIINNADQDIQRTRG